MELYIKAYCARKTGKLKDARLFYDKAILNEDIYGDFKLLLNYHSAHVSHLLGRFDFAVVEYKKVVKSTGNSEIENYARRLAERQLVDVAMIKGKFRTAEKKFIKFEKADTDPLWLAEVYRFRGMLLDLILASQLQKLFI